jgi:hypothetical protein
MLSVLSRAPISKTALLAAIAAFLVTGAEKTTNATPLALLTGA